MKELLYGCLAALMLLTTSCHQDELITVVEDDYRDQLVGTYSGSLAYEDELQATNASEVVHKQDIMSNQSLWVSKSTTQENGLIVNGNPLNLVQQSVEDKNQFSDVFIYSAKDCTGTESYTLQFYPKDKRLIMSYTHHRDCSTGEIKQKSTFTGVKE